MPKTITILQHPTRRDVSGKPFTVGYRYVHEGKVWVVPLDPGFFKLKGLGSNGGKATTMPSSTPKPKPKPVACKPGRIQVAYLRKAKNRHQDCVHCTAMDNVPKYMSTDVGQRRIVICWSCGKAMLPF